MARKDTAKKRLEQLIERNRGTRPGADIFDLYNPKPDWLRKARADRATTLGTTREDVVLRRAFEAFGFDPQDPRNWRRLLLELATIFFDEEVRPGPPQKWTREQWEQFKKDDAEVIDILKRKGVRPSNERIAAHLCKRSPYAERYKGYGEKALRRYMSRGRLPKALVARKKRFVNH
jgi:hypothetical protein